MKTGQSEALELAVLFEAFRSSSHKFYDGRPLHLVAAAELRRLHEVNADLIDALQFCSGTSYISDAHEVAEEALAKSEGK